jgi:glycosyltransferase involved in cell wall biosynthesis
MKRILYVEGCRDGTVGGSHTCLYSMVANIDRKRFYPVVAFYYDNVVAQRLRDLGMQTHILKMYNPLSFNDILRRISPLLGKISPVFSPVQKAINFGWYFIRPSLVFAYYIKKNRFDIVHVNNSLNSNHDWMLAAKLAGVKVISHERGISENLSGTSKLLGKFLDRLICMSKVIRDPLIRQGLNKERTVIVYDGIDVSKIRIRETVESLKSTYGIGKDDPVIGVVGNVKAWKGQETVVRAITILKQTYPNIKCLLVGDTVKGDTYKASLEKIIEKFAIKENVIFTGFQDNPADFMNIMDVVVHSSILPEPFGMVNLEAMYFKKPVISTNIGGPTEIFEDGEDGILIEPGNPVLLAQRISMLLNNPELRSKMGQKARQAVINKFEISSTVREIEGFYEKLYVKD